MGVGVEGHGLTVREQAIMDRVEAGMRPAAIAAELGVGREYVRRCIYAYNGSWAQNDAFEAMVIAGTKALAAACARSGGSFA